MSEEAPSQNTPDHDDLSKMDEESSLANTQPVRLSKKALLRRLPPGQAHRPDALLEASLAKTQPLHRSPTSADNTGSPGSVSAVKLRLNGEDTQPLRMPRRGGLWRDVWHRLLRNPEAIFGLVVIALMIFVAVFADWIAPYTIHDQHIRQSNLPPFWVEKSKIGTQGTLSFPLGTDRMGRDLFSWAVMGTRTSMALGLISAPLIALAGMMLGLLAGYAGGWVDNLLMRITDIFYAFPTLMVSIMVILVLRDTWVGAFQNGLLLLFIAFLTFGWAGAARLVRGSVLSVKNAEYIDAAHAVGIPSLRIIFKHIMPNCLAPLIIWVTLMIPQLILTEAILGYLQINMGPPSYREAFFDASWGGMIREGRSYIHVQPFTIMIPAAFVGLISIAFTFLGDALRDALDPVYQSVRRRE